MMTITKALTFHEDNKVFFEGLPEEFSKSTYENRRKMLIWSKRPMSLESAREYGFVLLIRIEPTTRLAEARERYIPSLDKWIDEDEFYENLNEIIKQNKSRGFENSWDFPRRCVLKEVECVRNIYKLSREKFLEFFENNS